MKKLTLNLSYLFALTCLLYVNSIVAQQGQCGECQVQIPNGIPDGTDGEVFYLQPLTNVLAYENTPFDYTLSFILPSKITARDWSAGTAGARICEGIDNPVGSGNACGFSNVVSINNITINSIALPPGLRYQPNKSNGVYSGAEQGCVRICGVPTQKGDFTVRVSVTATISPALATIPPLTFDLPIRILPDTSTTGCGIATQGAVLATGSLEAVNSTTLQFNTTRVNNQGPTAYSWVFSNDSTSMVKSPMAQTFGIGKQTAILTTRYYEHFIDSVIVDASNVSGAEADGVQDISGKVLVNGIDRIFLEEISSNNPVWKVASNNVINLTSGSVNLKVVLNENDRTGARPSSIDDIVESGSAGCQFVGVCQFFVESHNLSASDQGVIAFNGAQTSGRLVISRREVARFVDTFCFEVDPCPNISLLQTVRPPSPNMSDGLIVVKGNGGKKPYTYRWYKNGDLLINETEGSLINLSSGVYKVRITDANGCQSAENTINLSLTCPANLSLSKKITPATAGENNGAIDLTVGDTRTPHTFAWSNGATTEDVGQLAGDSTYMVTVTNADGCKDTVSILVTTKQGGCDNIEVATGADIINRCGRTPTVLKQEIIKADKGSSLPLPTVISNSNLPNTEYIITQKGSPANDGKGDKILGVVSRLDDLSTHAIKDMDGIYDVIALSYNLQDIQTLLQNILTGEDCCSTVGLVVTDFCPNLKSIGLNQGTDITGLARVLDLLKVFNPSLSSISIKGFVEGIDNEVNKNLSLLSGIGCSGGVDTLCYAYDAKAVATYAVGNCTTTDVVDPFISGSIKISPNPTSQFIHLELALKEHSDIHIEIINMLGEVVQTRKKNNLVTLSETFDWGAYPAGIYFLKIQTKQGAKTVKFVKK